MYIYKSWIWENGKSYRIYLLNKSYGSMKQYSTENYIIPENASENERKPLVCSKDYEMHETVDGCNSLVNSDEASNSKDWHEAIKFEIKAHVIIKKF